MAPAYHHHASLFFAHTREICQHHLQLSKLFVHGFDVHPHVQLQPQDYYDILHRRERMARGKPVGSRTTLQV